MTFSHKHTLSNSTKILKQTNLIDSLNKISKTENSGSTNLVKPAIEAMESKS